MLAGWKTLIFSLITTILGVLAVTDWTTVLHNPTTAGYIVTAIGICTAVLRVFTSTSIGSSK